LQVMGSHFQFMGYILSTCGLKFTVASYGSIVATYGSMVASYGSSSHLLSEILSIFLTVIVNQCFINIKYNEFK